MQVKKSLKVDQDISERLAQMDMTLANLKERKQGNLQLAVITTAKYFVPRLLGPFPHCYPGINISLSKSPITSKYCSA